MSSTHVQNELPTHAATAPPVDASPETGNRDAKLFGLVKTPNKLRTYDTAAEIVAALMKSPRSVYDLADELRTSTTSIRKYLIAFRKSGVVYQKSRAHRGNATYALQPSLFERADQTLEPSDQGIAQSRREQ